MGRIELPATAEEKPGQTSAQDIPIPEYEAGDLTRKDDEGEEETWCSKGNIDARTERPSDPERTDRGGKGGQRGKGGQETTED